MEDITIKVDGKEYDVRVEETGDGKILVHCNGDVYEVESTQDTQASIFNRVKKEKIEDSGKCVITAPLPGTIYEVKVNKGEKVREGQSLIKLIAMKMENDIIAKRSGIVKEIKVKKNDSVSKDDILMVIE
jgi:biotin carboxyl carrier protein